jgi:alkylation response protein AidB-like acyl-CoA dehydrogenase
MNFDWTAEEKAIKEKLARMFDPERLFELETMEEADLPTLKSLILKHTGALAETGYLHLGIGPDDRKHTMALVAAQEQLAGLSGSFFIAVETTSRLFGGLIGGFTKGEAVARIKEQLGRGEIIAGVAASESDDAESSTSAVQDESDWVITGAKDYVTNGPIADWIAVTAITEGRPAVFLIQPDQPGVDIGPRLRTLGYNGLGISSIRFQRTKVLRDFVLGPFDADAHLRFLTLMQDLILTVASVGLIHRVVAFTKAHADSHTRGGRPIFRFQEIRFKIAEMLTLYQTAQLLMYRAAWLYSVADPEAATVLHCAKVFSAETAEQVASMAMQILAGRGYLSGNPIERAYRDANLAGIAGTTCEIARMSIADDLLGRYR